MERSAQIPENSPSTSSGQDRREGRTSASANASSARREARSPGSQFAGQPLRCSSPAGLTTKVTNEPILGDRASEAQRQLNSIVTADSLGDSRLDNPANEPIPTFGLQRRDRRLAGGLGARYSWLDAARAAGALSGGRVSCQAGEAIALSEGRPFLVLAFLQPFGELESVGTMRVHGSAQERAGQVNMDY